MPERDPKYDRAARDAKQAGIGKLLPEDLYVHRSVVSQLPALLRSQVAKAVKLAARVVEVEYNVVKIGLKGDRVSLLSYPKFDTAQLPELAHSIVVNVRQRSVREIDYSQRAKPPVLHRKELLLGGKMPQKKKAKKNPNTSGYIMLPRIAKAAQQVASSLRRRGFPSVVELKMPTVRGTMRVKFGCWMYVGYKPRRREAIVMVEPVGNRTAFNVYQGHKKPNRLVTTATSISKLFEQLRQRGVFATRKQVEKAPKPAQLASSVVAATPPKRNPSKPKAKKPQLKPRTAKRAAALPWRRQVVTIPLKPKTKGAKRGRRVKTPAYVKGTWAVHRPHGSTRGWSISWEPTGHHLVTVYGKLDEAKAAVESLLKSIPEIAEVKTKRTLNKYKLRIIDWWKAHVDKLLHGNPDPWTGEYYLGLYPEMEMFRRVKAQKGKKKSKKKKKGKRNPIGRSRKEAEAAIKKAKFRYESTHRPRHAPYRVYVKGRVGGDIGVVIQSSGGRWAGKKGGQQGPWFHKRDDAARWLYGLIALPAKKGRRNPLKMHPASSTLGHNIMAKLKRAGYTDVSQTTRKNVRQVSYAGYMGKKKVRRSLTLGTVPGQGTYIGTADWSGIISNMAQVPGVAVTSSTKGLKAKPPYQPKKKTIGSKVAGYFKNPTQAKKAMGSVIAIFREERAKAMKKEPALIGVKLQLDPYVHDTPRHFAMTGKDKGGQVCVIVAPELNDESPNVIRGVIRHELGHAVQFLKRTMPKKGTKTLSKYDAIERNADRIAEKLFGAKIYYDKRGVEVSGPGARGTRPRPKGLK